MTIHEAFEKYQHLDRVLTDQNWGGTSFQMSILNDLWCAVRAAALAEAVMPRQSDQPHQEVR